MKIAIIGAGIIGVTTAYELACSGHEVTVFERHSAAAEEASFATAGIVSPGWVAPWAAPGMPAKVLRSLLLGRNAPVALSLPLSRSDIAWIRQWLQACKLQTLLSNRANMQRLAFYSQQRLQHLSQLLELQYERRQGTLVLLRSVKEARLIEPTLALLAASGVAFSKLSAEQARLVEPGLQSSAPFLGAVQMPGDEVANCRQFALLLKEQAQKKGVIFVFNTTVERIEPAQAASISIAKLWLAGSPKGDHPQPYDQVILCAGVASAGVAKPLGIALPMAAVYGYSISLPLREEMDAPTSAVFDQRYQASISRLGNRIRVSGSAHLGGHVNHIRAASVQTLYQVLQDWFPASMPQAAARLGNHAQIWKGARPMLPDGSPVIGPSGVPGIWLNTGHGANGWAMACGSARLLADMVSGQSPDIDPVGFAIARLKH